LKKGYVVVLGLAAAVVALVVVPRLLTTERERVARVISRLEGRVEARDAAGVCHLLTEDYRDNQGHNRGALRARLAAGFPRLASVSLAVKDLEIEVTGETAAANFLFEAVVRARDHGRGPPWRPKTRVRLRLRKSEGEWRVCEAEYRMPPVADF